MSISDDTHVTHYDTVVISDSDTTADTAPKPAVTTTYNDYAPGATATITTSGFTAGATLAFRVVHVDDPGADGVWGTEDDGLGDNSGAGHDTWHVTDGVQSVDAGADGAPGTKDDVVTGDLDGVVNGTVVTSWYVNPDDSLGARFLLSASAIDPGPDALNGTADDVAVGPTALATFTDATETDLTAPGASTAIGGAIFADAANLGADPANYYSFLALTDIGGEIHGFNSDDSATDNGLDPSNDEIFWPQTQTVRLSDVPVKIVDGVAYYEMRLDLNQSVGGQSGAMSLDAFQIYLSSSAGIESLAELQAETLVYDMDTATPEGDRTLLLSEASTGNGADDYSVLVPVADFSTADASLMFLYLYAQLGAKGGAYAESGSIEYWRLQSPGTLTGVKFNDRNNSGARDADGVDGTPGNADDESGIGGVTIFLDTDQDGLLDAGERSTVTAGDGSYSFVGLAPGLYQIDEVLQPGWTQTTGGSETAVIGQAGVQSVTVAPIGNFLAASVPSLTIVKGADKAAVTVAGEVVTYTITVDNTGNVDLTGVVVTDAFAGGAALTGGDDGDGVLETNETWVYTADYTVSQADLNAGAALVNVASVDTGQTAPQQAGATTTVGQSPSLTIAKGADKAAVTAAGEVVTYTITVDNTGNVDLTGVVVTDAFAGGAALTGGDDGDGVLETNETWVYTADYTVSQADLNAGDALVNVASVDTDQTAPQQAGATTTVGQSPSLTIAKGADKAAVTAAGEVVTYTITVDNTGNVDLTGVVVTDAFAGGAALTGGDDGDGVLETNETWVYTADYTVSQADLNAGAALVNVASVDTDQTAPQQAGATTTVGQSPSLTIAKGADKAAVTVAGEVVTYTITVDNTGNVDLTGVVVTDAFAGGAALTGGDDGDGVLETNETWVYTADYTVSQADLNAGAALVNVASVDTGQTAPQQAGATTTVGQSPSLTIAKGADKAAVTAAGEVVTYTITVDNTGNVDLTGVVVTDAFAGGAALTGGDDGDGVLETNETWVYTADYTVSQADLNAGAALVNVASVDTDQTAPQQAGATTTVGQSPSLTIAKGADKAAVTVAGEVITYTITVDNTGNAAVDGVVVSDPLLSGVPLVRQSGDTDTDGRLDVGETWTYTGSYAVTQDDLDGEGNAGADLAIDNTATASGTGVTPVIASASVSVDQKLALAIDKSAVVDAAGDGIANAVGDMIDYTIEVTNAGNAAVDGVAVSDPLLSGVPLVRQSGDADTDGRLDVGETWTYTGSYAVTQDDLDGRGNAGADLAIDNTATASGTGVTPVTASASVPVPTPVDQKPSIDVVMANGGVADMDGNGHDIGDTITYTYTVTNSGNVTLSGVALVDDNHTPGDTSDDLIIALGDTTLDPGESTAGTVTVTLDQADIDAGSLTNIVTANGAPPAGPAVSDTDTNTVLLNQDPSLEVAKSVADVDGRGPRGIVGEAGEVITYQITVKNTGDAALTGVIVTDQVESQAATPATLVSGDIVNPGVFDVGETWIYSATYTVQQADIDGKGGGDFDIDNTTTADSVESDPDSDSASVNLLYKPKVAIDKTVADIVNPDFTDGGSKVDQAGDVITWRIEVENTGNVTLTGVGLTDKVESYAATAAVLESGDGNNNGQLDVGETWVYNATYTVTQADIDGANRHRGDGDIDNKATVDTDQTQPRSDYASVQIDPTVDLRGYQFVDLNGDGDKDQGEARLYSWKVQLWKDDGDGVFDHGDKLVASTYTNSNGHYLFDDVAVAGHTYFIKEQQKDGWIQTGPLNDSNAFDQVTAQGGIYKVEVATGSDAFANLDFGNQLAPGPGVRTPGFWKNDGYSFRDGVGGDESKALQPGFPEGDLLSAVDGTGDGVVNATKGLLIGDYDKNGKADEGEDVFVIAPGDARNVIDALHEQVLAGSELAQDAVLSWLNYPAGDPHAGIEPDGDYTYPLDEYNNTSKIDGTFHAFDGDTYEPYPHFLQYF